MWLETANHTNSLGYHPVILV